MTFGMFHRDGGCSGEMQMKWIDLGGRRAPRLEVFDDAWMELAQFSDVIAALGENDSKDITDAQFVEILKAHGFADLTTYERKETP